MRNRLFLTLMLLGAACESSIQHGLDERQANEIQAALAGRGIESSKQAEGGRKPSWSVAVPTRSAADAVQTLGELGLPRPHAEGLREVYGKGGWVPSASEERALYLSALSGELSRTLESFEGVIAARVHLVLPPVPRAGQAPALAKAAVFLRARNGARARLEESRNAIRSLVAGSVEGLSSELVTLVIEEPPVHMREAPVPAPARLPWGPRVFVAPFFIVAGVGALSWGAWRRRPSLARASKEI